MLVRTSLQPIPMVLPITLSVKACSGRNNNNYDHKNNYETEGAVINIVNSRSFFLGNILVTHDSSTRFEDGSIIDLAVGKHIEVEGARTNPGTVTAREIENGGTT